MLEEPFGLIRSILHDYMRGFQKRHRLSRDSMFERDVINVIGRLNHEGSKFALVTLKEISNALLEGLRTGSLPSLPSFRCTKGSKLPVLFQDFWANIFDKTGQIHNFKESADSYKQIESVRFLYQIGSFFTKMNVPYSSEIIEPFIEEFVKTDAELSYQYTPYVHTLLSRAANVCGRILDHFDLTDLKPRHGPGAVFGGQRQEEKWDFTTIFLDMDAEYDSMEYFYSSPHHLIDRLNDHANLKWEHSSTSRYMIVPKTVARPRGICIEPLEKQYLQQGQMSAMVKSIESQNLTSGQINFTSQTINRQLALLASSGVLDYATIDLSDASDRVSMQLVRDLFRNHANVFNQLVATRSAHVLLPDGRKIKLNKFAAMGSAVCFPVEAIAFYSICVAAISIAADDECWTKHCQRVYVYGDDIIIPNEYAEQCITALESVGFKANTLKSYWTGHFRESCGLHAFKGVDVTPVRVSKLPPGSPYDGSKISSYLSYARAFDKVGIHIESIYQYIEVLLNRKLPFSTDTSGVLGRYASSSLMSRTLSKTVVRHKWDTNLQCWLYLVPSLRGRERDVNYKDEWDHLLSNQLSTNPDLDPSKTVLRDSVNVKWVWTPLY